MRGCGNVGIMRLRILVGLRGGGVYENGLGGGGEGWVGYLLERCEVVG